MASGNRISLKLTPEQQKQIQQAIGKEAGALELTVEELEERIAPVVGQAPNTDFSSRIVTGS